VFIWELGGGQLPSNFPERDRLLQATKNAVLGITLMPGIPSPLEPKESTTGVMVAPVLAWTSSPNASSYRLQVSTDSTFASIFFDQSSILQTSFQLDTLLLRTTYSWRVCGINSDGASEWSVSSHFTTIAGLNLPSAWSYISRTGSSATIMIPDTVIPLIGDSALSPGDAIGVFYPRGDILACAGYGVWTTGNPLPITIWGDNPSTTIKDGLTANDTLLFKIWSVRNQKEYNGIAAYQSGDSRYRVGNIYVLRSLYDSTTHGSGGTTSIEEGLSPPVFDLEQNYPNPFNPSTKIEYSLAYDSHTTLEIFNVLGQKIVTLVDDDQRPGPYQIQFVARGLPSGMYFYRLTATPTSSDLPPSTRIRRMTLLK
jgi:hypothetical protein